MNVDEHDRATREPVCPDCGADVSADTEAFRQQCAAHVSAKGMTGAECAEAFIAEFGIRCKACEHRHRVEEAANGSWLARAALLGEQCAPDETVVILPGNLLGIEKK